MVTVYMGVTGNGEMEGILARVLPEGVKVVTNQYPFSADWVPLESATGSYVVPRAQGASSQSEALDEFRIFLYTTPRPSN